MIIISNKTNCSRIFLKNTIFLFVIHKAAFSMSNNRHSRTHGFVSIPGEGVITSQLCDQIQSWQWGIHMFCTIGKASSKRLQVVHKKTGRSKATWNWTQNFKAKTLHAAMRTTSTNYSCRMQSEGGLHPDLKLPKVFFFSNLIVSLGSTYISSQCSLTLSTQTHIMLYSDN